MANRCVGCGLDVNDDGTLIANVKPWPYACAQTANGGGMYCDPATGILQSEPHAPGFYQATSGSNDGSSVNVPVGQESRYQHDPMTITNNFCDTYEYILLYGYAYDVSGDVGVDYELQIELFVNGTSYIGHSQKVHRTTFQGGNTDQDEGRDQIASQSSIVIPPGGSFTIYTQTSLLHRAGSSGTLTMLGLWAYTSVIGHPVNL